MNPKEQGCNNYSHGSRQEKLDLDLKNTWTTLLHAFVLILWYSGPGLEKCSDYLTGVQWIIWCTALRLKQHLDYLNGLRFYYKLHLDLGWLNELTK